ncbi:MAG: transporter substrate-binding domain-containing protein [Puniceicoccales bacterium]|jgi:ABC-type amino acid transport substrate-binding protein|nr:transporter substrate-binding domain-containing protein [Puniceicoccales bacterium]
MKVGRIGLFFLCFFAINAFASEGDKTEKWEGFKGITITEKQIGMMKGIANFLFSYGEGSENSPSEGIDGAQKIAPLAATLTKSKKILRVGIVSDNLPFSAIRNEMPVGFEVDLLRLLSEEEGIDLEISPIDVTKIDENIRENRIDIALGGILRNGSDPLFDYSDGYLKSDVVAVFLKKSQKNSQKFSLKEKSIGLIEGFFFEQHIRQANIQNTKIVAFKSNGELFGSLLKTNKNSSQPIDILLTNSHTACDWIAKYPELDFLSLKLANDSDNRNEIAVQMKKNSPWLSTINRGIKDLVGSSKFSELMRRWSIEKI